MAFESMGWDGGSAKGMAFRVKGFCDLILEIPKK